MSFRWLSSLVGAKTSAGKVGIRRKAAPQAQRDLANEIGAHAVQVRRIWVRDVNVDGRRQRTVIVRVDPRGRRDIEAWLTGPDAGGDAQVFPLAAAATDDAPQPSGRPATVALTSDIAATDAADAASDDAAADDLATESPTVGGEALSIKTSWLLLAHADEAVLLGAVVNDTDPTAVRRFNIRFDADADRTYLEALARTGTLALLAVPLRWGPDGDIASPRVYIPVDRAPLHDFLRERPAAVV